MIDRRRACFPFLTAAAVALVSSCAPNETAQTVSFVLALNAERLTSIEFVVSYSSGDFAGSTGQCKVSSAAGPPDASLAAQVAARTIQVSAPLGNSGPAVERGAGTTTTVPSVSSTTQASSTTHTTQTTGEPPTTTTTVPDTTTTMVPDTTTTTTIVGNLSCGDGVRDDGEECDDGNEASGDGCDGNCNAEFAFESVVFGQPSQLRVTVVNGLGIAPGSTLAFCQFQGDVQDADFVITATECDLYGPGACNTATDAQVTESTTTTTTTTSTTTTSSVTLTTTTTLALLTATR